MSHVKFSTVVFRINSLKSTCLQIILQETTWLRLRHSAHCKANNYTTTNVQKIFHNNVNDRNNCIRSKYVNFFILVLSVLQERFHEFELTEFSFYLCFCAQYKLIINRQDYSQIITLQSYNGERQTYYHELLLNRVTRKRHKINYIH